MNSEADGFDLNKPYIVIFEERAHLPIGHFSNAFADVADGFCAAGCDVEVVMPHQWARANEGPRRWRATTYGRVSSLGFRGILWARDRQLFGRIGLAARKAGRSLLAGVAISRAIRRHGRQPLGVVIFASDFLDPRVLERMGASRRQIIHDISLSDLRTLSPARRCTAVDGTGAGTVWAQSSSTWLTSDAARHLGKDASARLDICCTRDVIPRRAEAREELGLAAGAKVALLFGAGHEGQRPGVVFDAFRDEEDWQLLVGGGIARSLDAVDIDDWRCRPTIRPGYQGGPDRERLLTACDLVIISTTPSFLRDSGVLTDAISHRKPVIATAGSSPGTRVVELGIGDVFDATSSDSLRSVLCTIDLDRATEATGPAAERYSGRSLAMQHLAIFRWLRCGQQGPMPR